jgi:hypothetical protein
MKQVWQEFYAIINMIIVTKQLENSKKYKKFCKELQLLLFK